MEAMQQPPQLSADDGLDRGFSNWFNALPKVRELIHNLLAVISARDHADQGCLPIAAGSPGC
jgi:hypothetical protein